MTQLKFRDYEWAMGEALKLAEESGRKDEVPIGACVLNPEGKIIFGAGNLKESVNDPCGHAEILALRGAALKNDSWRLNDCTLVVTLEPCLMCMGALWQARIGKVVFGAYDPKGGALSLGYKINSDSRLNHSFGLIGGVRHYECSKLLSDFFKQKRSNYSYRSP